MRGPSVDPAGPTILRRAAEHLTDRCAGVFLPELVHRCAAQAHTALASTARIHTYLAPIAVHTAGERLAALARTKASPWEPVRQVLFVDAHDTGPAQIAAGLLAHHAGAAVVACSAGIDPGAAVDPFAVEILAQYGTEPAGLAPKPVADEMLQTTDWVVTIGVHDALPVSPATAVQNWPLEQAWSEDRGPRLVADLDTRVHALWVEITTSVAGRPTASGRAAGS